MGGGGQQMATSTTNSVPWNSGNLSTVQNRAIDLLNNAPFNAYSGQTLATPNDPFTIQGLQNAGNVGMAAGNATGNLVPGAQQQALQANQYIAGGGGAAATNPYFNVMQQLSQGGNPSGSAIDQLMNFGNSPAAQSLGATASGQFLDPANNPYLAGTYGQAADQVRNTYMSSTAPQADSAFEGAGRFNSGGTAGAQSVNQQNLGKTLSGLGSQIFGGAYQNERNLMNSAGANLGNLSNSAYSTAGQLANQGTVAQGQIAGSAIDAWNRLLNTQQASIGATPGLTQMPGQDYTQTVNAGNQLTALTQAQLSDAASRYLAQQQAPWLTDQTAATIIGGAIPGMTQSQTPYWTPSAFSQGMTGLSQGLGMANGLFGAGGMFASGGAGASALAGLAGLI